MIATYFAQHLYCRSPHCLLLFPRAPRPKNGTRNKIKKLSIECRGHHRHRRELSLSTRPVCCPSPPHISKRLWYPEVGGFRSYLYEVLHLEVSPGGFPTNKRMSPGDKTKINGRPGRKAEKKSTVFHFRPPRLQSKAHGALVYVVTTVTVVVCCILLRPDTAKKCVAQSTRRVCDGGGREFVCRSPGTLIFLCDPVPHTSQVSPRILFTKTLCTPVGIHKGYYSVPVLYFLLQLRLGCHKANQNQNNPRL